MLAQAANWDTGTLAVLLIFGLPIVAVIATMWHKVEKLRGENELKRSMIERGMSVEEIERVLAIRPPAK
jgi:hypothetical protein